MGELMAIVRAVEGLMALLKVLGVDVSTYQDRLNVVKAMSDSIDDALDIAIKLFDDIRRLVDVNQESIERGLRAAKTNPAMVKPSTSPSLSTRGGIVGCVLILMVSLFAASCCSNQHQVVELPETYATEAIPATETTPAIPAEPGTFPGYSVTWPKEASFNPGDYATVKDGEFMVTTCPMSKVDQ